MRKLLAAATIALLPVALPDARAEDEPSGKAARESLHIDTEHIFGFNEGGDIGEAGDKELEKETAMRFGKRAGSYAAVSSLFNLKYVPVEGVLISPGILFAYHNISNVPGLDDRSGLSFQGLQFELKYNLVDREHAPFGMTVFAAPRWTRIDEASGERAGLYSTEFTLAFDKELIANRLFGVINLVYEPEVSRPRDTGIWERTSQFGFGTGVTAQIRPGMFLGAEARYLRSHDGLAMGALKGDAFFFGPTFYSKLTDHSFLSLAWNAQLAGRAVGEAGALDLTNFERHQVRLRIGMEF